MARYAANGDTRGILLVQQSLEMVFGATEFRVTVNRRRRSQILNSLLAPTPRFDFRRALRVPLALPAVSLSGLRSHLDVGSPRRDQHTYLRLYFSSFSEATLMANYGWSDVDASDYCYDCTVTRSPV